MAANFAFKCSSCGNVHEGSPSFGFLAPDQYAGLCDEQKERLGMLSDDLCTVTSEHGKDYFVRAILEIPIHGIEEPFLWGVWVSASQKSYERYSNPQIETVEGERFFGWICNDIALYPYDKPRPADVYLQTGGTRPKVVLHRGDHENDPLVIDQVEGISVTRAQELAERALHE